MGSALTHQSKIKFDGAVGAFHADALVVSVDGGSLLTCQIHRRKAVDLVRDAAVVSRVGALYHEVGRDDASAPGGCHGRGDLPLALAIGHRDAAGIHAVKQGDLHVLVIHRLFQILQCGIDGK